jgi:glycosyltransferase involved in cell wall biosynthesis
MPRISVCVPVYDPGPYLRPAIESILGQDCENLEIVVVDDSSNEPIQRTIDELADERITLHRNERNVGLVANWNRCLALARGEYVTIFHHDDVMREGNLADRVAVLDAHRNVGFVYSNIETIDDGGKVTGGHWLPQLPADAIESGRACFERLAVEGNFIACPTVMARASCYQELGGFDPRLPFTCDLEMWMRIASQYDVGYLAARGVAVRIHPDQETQRFAGAGREIREVQRALKIALAEHAPAEVSTGLEGRARRNLVTWAYRMGRWKVGQRQWRSALGYLWSGSEAFLRSLG